MGLYIDMEMPQNCQSCNFYNGIGCKATGRMFAIFYNVATRRSDCPLTEVHEPHGRLIDADALPWYLANEPIKYASYEDWERLCDAIKTAPTVIPASEEVDESQRDYERAVEDQRYCEMYEPTYDPETGAM